MDISGLKEAMQALYQAQSGKTTETSGRGSEVSFAGSMKEAMEKEAMKKEGNAFPEGEDVVMSHPPLYATKYKVDMDKPKEEMSMDEYKQYICNRVSALPVSASMKVSGSGALIFKEEAFAGMKDDPEYEETVIGMLREKYASQVSPYMPNVSFQVIGASIEECYGSAIPLKNYGLAGTGNLSAWAYGLSGLGMLSPGLAGLEANALGLTGMEALNLTGLGSNVSGLSGLGANILGLAGAGTNLSGLTGIRAGSFGLTASAADAASGLGGGIPAYGSSYAAMVGAYKKTAEMKNGNAGIREYQVRRRDKGCR